MDDLEILPVMEDPERPQYREVNPNLLKPPFRIAIVGASKSGKSNYLMNYFRPSFYGGDKKRGIDPCFTKIIVFSPNLGMDSTTRHLRELCEEQDIHMHYSDSIVKGIIESQKMREGDPSRDRILIIADDLIAMGCQPQSLIFSSSTYLRHLDCSMIYITQTYKGHYSLPPMARNNIDGLIMFRCPSAQQTKSLCDDLCGTFGSKQNVNNLLSYATQKPYHFCFFDYRNLRAFHNHTEFMWSKYKADGSYNEEFDYNNIGSLEEAE